MEPLSELGQNLATGFGTAVAPFNLLCGLVGVTLGRLVFITESTGGAPVVQEFAVRSLAAFADVGPTPISRGELEFRMTVQAIFEIM